jgi:hypothetical protein
VNHLSPATPGTLRERFVEDMTVRGFTDKTRHDYIRTVAGFAAFLERSPSTATAEDIRRFQIHQSERGMNAPAMNSAVAALRFFFNYTADRPDLARKLIRLRYPRKLPNVLSPDETARLIAATTCLKHRAALCVAYGAGLRVAEVASLKVGDIDSERMLIRVERGKGGRCRHALLSADLLIAAPGLSVGATPWRNCSPCRPNTPPGPTPCRMPCATHQPPRHSRPSSTSICPTSPTSSRHADTDEIDRRPSEENYSARSGDDSDSPANMVQGGLVLCPRITHDTA